MSNIAQLLYTLLGLYVSDADAGLFPRGVQSWFLDNVNVKKKSLHDIWIFQVGVRTTGTHPCIRACVSVSFSCTSIPFIEFLLYHCNDYGAISFNTGKV